MKIASSVLVLALCACVGCGGGKGEAEDPRIADKSRPLVFVTHPTDPPSCYMDADGECRGTDVDLARKIAERMGRGLSVEVMAFERMIPRLKEGTADFAIATITINEARRRDVNFSVPYAISGNSFLYMASRPRPRMSQAASLRIGAEGGTTGDIYLSLHDCDPIRFSHMNDALPLLEEGKLDAVFFDDIPLRAWAAKSGGRMKVSPLETREGYGVAVDKRRPDVLKAANEVVVEMVSGKRGVE